MPRAGLWTNRDFLSLWAGQSISLLGDQVSNLALPLTAAIVLGASPAEMGLLGALETLPYLALGLLAGAMVDRWPRRPVLITADLGRALLLGIIPIAFIFGVLRLEVLFAVALVVGIFNVFFVVGYAAFVPSVVATTDLVEGNSRLAVSQQMARVVGPGLAGALVQLLSAPVAIAVDASSFLVSAACLGRIRARDDGSNPTTAHGKLLVEIRDGLALALRHPLLRPILISVALGNLGDGMVFGSGAFILYATRELGVTPAAIGGIFAGLGMGGVAGAALVGPITARAGFGRTVIATLLVWAIGMLSLPAVPLQSGSTVAVLTGIFVGVGVVNPIFNTNLLALVQTVTPSPLLGRISGTSRFITWGVLPIGAALGGQIGDGLGLRAPMLVAGALVAAAFVSLATSRIRSIVSVAAAAELRAKQPIASRTSVNWRALDLTHDPGRIPRIYHITTQQAWTVAQSAGSYTESTRGLSLAEVGFIHCSYADQVTRVADALYRGMSGLVLLVIAPDRLEAELRDEDLDGCGEAFPHIYGPLNLDAIVDVLPLEAAEDGRFTSPAALGAET